MRRRGIRGPELTAPAAASAPRWRRLAGPLLIAALAVGFLGGVPPFDRLRAGSAGRALLARDVLLPANYLDHFQPWQPQAAHRPQAARPAPEHWNALAWDAIAQYYPWRAFAHHALARGVIPLWNPFQFCGMPFVANSQSAVFYPPNVLFYLLDPARAFAVAAALHLLLGGCFTYALLRALGRGRYGATFGGVTFAFCGFLAAWLQLPTVLDTAVWLPLALCCVARLYARSPSTRSTSSGQAAPRMNMLRPYPQRVRYVVGAGFAVGTALLAGHPQMFLYVAGTTALYFVFCALSSPPDVAQPPRSTGSELALSNAKGQASAVRERLGIWVAAGAAAAALALAWGAVQLLPSVELFSFSHRAAAASAPGYSAYLRSAMPWQQLITLILPEFMGNPAYGTYWGRGNFAEYAAYIGVVPLLLAVLGVIWRRDRHTIFFAGLAVFALLAAVGTPVNLLIYRIPGFSSLGGPARMLFVYCAALAVLAGTGADAAASALTDAGAARRFARHFAIGAIAITVIVIGFVFAIASSLGVPPLSLLAAPAMNILVALLALSVSVAVLWAASGPGIRWSAGGARLSGLAGAALVILLGASVAELFAFGVSYPRTAPRSRVYPPSALTSYLRERAVTGRIMPLYESWGLRDFPRAVLPPNSAMVYGLYDVQGYDSLYLARYRSVLAAVQRRDPSPLANGNMLLGAPCDPRLLAALGVQYVLSQSRLAAPGLRLERSGEVNVYRVENFVPRAYTARRAVAAGDLLGALPRLGEAASAGVVLETRELLGRSAGAHPARGVAGRRPSTGSGQALRDVTFLGQGLNHMRLDAHEAGWLVLSDAYYPGWRAWVEGRPARIHIANGAFRAVWVRPREHEVLMRFDPTSFRLGLFVTLVAAAVGMCAVGVSAARLRRR